MTIFKLGKRNKISSLLVYVLHKTRNKAFLRRGHAKTGKKCTKKRDTSAKLLFCFVNLLIFGPSHCSPRRWILRWPEPIYRRVGYVLNRVFRQERFDRFLWFLASLIKNGGTFKKLDLFSCRYKTVWDISVCLKPHFEKMSITSKA